ncbi:MAG: hypothetical protein JWO98_3496 [Frankiales bacterium]|nr:hypothetical protein [Frankiales bacterium]
MNRAERRRARVRVQQQKPGQDIAAAAACPDCDADVAVRELSPGVFHGTVSHDDTCPWYAALRRDLE